MIILLLVGLTVSALVIGIAAYLDRVPLER
jgi:hypothetical protein